MFNITLDPIPNLDWSEEYCNIKPEPVKDVKYAEVKSDIEVVEQEVVAVKDGGETEALLTEVNLSGQGDEMELRDELLAKSPNVSEEVLKATAEKTVPLPDVMLKEVMAANPKAGKDKEVMETLENAPDPMPEYMIDEVEASANAVSGLEEKEGELAVLKKEKEVLAKGLTNDYLREETTYDPAAAEVLLEEKDDMDSDKELLKMKVAEEDVAGIDEMKESMDDRVDPATAEQEALARYEQFIDIRKGLISNNKNWLTADEATLTQLEALAELDGEGGRYARNVLEFLGADIYYRDEFEPPADPQGRRSSPSMEEKQEHISIWPNPANEYFILDYEMENMSSSAMLNVDDPAGKRILSRRLTNPKDQVLVDVRSLPTGMYTWSVSDMGSILHSGTVVKQD